MSDRRSRVRTAPEPSVLRIVGTIVLAPTAMFALLFVAGQLWQALA
ncbi:hypothetical protein ACFOMD_17185 [Sphingoaurantiacus capsulatus]|uniref:ABC transporter permease n=1 Tax=Sphingoaurantiacus capsulatus TaxID=1771310 RepID=A0ABV7XEE9_9SPHN